MNTQDRVRRFAQEVAGPTAEQERETVGETGDKSAKLWGWALQWDGFALAEIQKRQDGHELSASELPEVRV